MYLHPRKPLHISYAYGFNSACLLPISLFEMQEGMEVKLGRSYYVSQFTGSKRRKVLKQDSFYYVPLLQAIKQLLENRAVRIHLTIAQFLKQTFVTYRMVVSLKTILSFKCPTNYCLL